MKKNKRLLNPQELKALIDNNNMDDFLSYVLNKFYANRFGIIGYIYKIDKNKCVFYIFDPLYNEFSHRTFLDIQYINFNFHYFF